MMNEMNSMDFKYIVGNRAREARLRCGHTQKDVAKWIHVPQSSLCSFENGNTLLLLNKIVALAEEYDIPVGSLFQDSTVVPCKQQADFDLKRTKKCLGGYIRHIREKNKWSQSYLAYVSHICPSTVSHFERGHRCSLETFLDLCNALEAIPGDILAMCITYDFAGHYNPETGDCQGWWTDNHIS